MEPRKHFIVSNRTVRADSWTLDPDAEPFGPLHYTYYNVPKTPNETTKVSQKVTPLVKKTFIDHVVEEAKQLPDTCRNVTIYVHGFHHIINKSYKIDLLNNLVKQYCLDEQGVGKFIYFSWPATGARTKVDDMAHALGTSLWRNPEFDIAALKKRLNSNGIELNFWTHSFGHRILNGYLSEQKGNAAKQFNKVFLFASDIPHRALDKNNPGIALENPKNAHYTDAQGKTFDTDYPRREYNLTRLETIADKANCYYTKYDRFMVSSLEGELKGHQLNQPAFVDSWMCAGSVGKSRATKPMNIRSVDVSKWIRKEDAFKKAFNKSKVVKELENTISKKKVDGAHRMFALEPAGRRPWQLLHQYLIMSPSVVADVKKNL